MCERRIQRNETLFTLRCVMVRETVLFFPQSHKIGVSQQDICLTPFECRGTHGNLTYHLKTRRLCFLSELSEHRRNQKFQIGSGITKNWDDWAELYIDDFWIWKELKRASQQIFRGSAAAKLKQLQAFESCYSAQFFIDSNFIFSLIGNTWFDDFVSTANQ